MKTGSIAAALVAGACVAGPFGAATAQPVELKMAYPSAPRGLLYEAMSGWAAEVTKASEGAAEIKIFAGGSLGNFVNLYDRVVSGVAELGWGILGPISAQFPKTNVVTLPFETASAKEAATALWRIYANGAIASEHERHKLLTFAVFANVSLHARKPLKTLDDVKGMKISAEGRAISQTVTRLGAAPVTMPVADLYQALQRSTVDAVAIAWPAISTFKLYEVVNYHLDVYLANDDGFAIFNKDAYARLPAKAKSAVDRLSGEPFVARLVAATTGLEAEARTIVTPMPGQVTAKLEAAEEARWRRTVEPVTAEWIKSTPDGARVLAAYRAEVKKIRGM